MGLRVYPSYVRHTFKGLTTLRREEMRMDASLVVSIIRTPAAPPPPPPPPPRLPLVATDLDAAVSTIDNNTCWLLDCTL